MKRPLMSAPIPFSAPTGSRKEAARRTKPLAKGQALPTRLGITGTALSKNKQSPLSAKSSARKNSTARQQRRQRIIEALEQRQVFAAPTLTPLVDQNLFSGAPLQIALQAADADGDALSFSATSDNPNIVAELRATTNRYLVLDIEHVSSGQPGDSSFSGQIIFQLFEDLTPDVTNRIITLVNQGFYDNLIFHRVINNFVIQGGDPLGNGTGGSGTNFDDQFVGDLQHTVSGLLSMAKSTDDTNDSQFFVTEGPQRNLDFNHSIFGMLVSGETLRDQISNVPTDPDNGPDANGDGANDPDGDKDDNGLSKDQPLSNVTITSASIQTLTTYSVLTVKAANGFTGSGTITVTVDDGNGGTAQETFTVNATPDTTNNDPFLINPPLQIDATANGAAVNYQLQAQDIDGGTITYNAYFENAADSSKVTLSINKNTGLLTVTPINNFSGIVNIMIMASPISVADHEFIEQQAASNNVSIQTAYNFYANNSGIKFDTQSVPIAVAPTAPTGIDLLATSDTGGSDSDNLTNKNNASNATALTFRISGVTAGDTVELFDGATLIGTAIATGTTVDVTTNGSTTLTDGLRTFTARRVLVDQTIDAGNQNRTINLNSPLSTSFGVLVDTTGPVFTSTPVTSLVQFSAYNYDADTSNDPSSVTSYNLANGPAGMTIDPDSGEVTWIPTQAQINAGFADVVIEAMDNTGNISTQNFTITFVPNEAPSLDAIGNQSVDEGNTFSYALVAQDVNLPGETLTYSLVSGPAGTVVNPTTGVVTFATTESDGGTTKNFTVRVTDAGGLFAEQTFDLTINDTNTNPIVAAIATQAVTENQELVVQVNATDSDLPANTLSYELLSGPTGTTIDANGVIRWTTNESHGGTQQTISFRVNDGVGGSTTRNFLVNVSEQNQLPTLTVQTSHVIDELQTLTFTAAASDADAPIQTLTFSSLNAPAGFVVNPTTGVITWTPNEAQGPATYTFQLRVTDTLGGFDSETITITVNEINQAPVLGELNTLLVFPGGTLTAQIPGYDADLPAQALDYVLETGPAGISLNAATGELSWVLPASATEGIVSITVRLTDATGATVTRDYQIQVSNLNIGAAYGLVTQWTTTTVPPAQDNRPTGTALAPAATILVDGQIAPVSVLGDNSANSVTPLLGGTNRLQAVGELLVVEVLKPVIEGGATGAADEAQPADEKSDTKPEPRSSGNPFDNTSAPAAPANGTTPTGFENPQSNWQRRFDWREQLRAAALAETDTPENLDLNWVRHAPQQPALTRAEPVSSPAADVLTGSQPNSQPETNSESQPLAASVGILAAASLALRPRKSAPPVTIPLVNDEVRRQRGPRRNWY